MSLSDALALAAQGFHMFPCEPNGKLPLVKGWPAKATRDPAKIERWAQKFEGCNWGIFTGRFGDSQALLVVDVDNKDGKNGGASLVALELQGHEFPSTMETATPTGGRHLIYAVPQAVKQGVDVLGTGLDIRSKGGFVLAPGSVIDGREYAIDRPDVPQPAPQWLIDRCGLALDRPGEATADRRALLARVDPERAMARAIEYLVAQETVTEGGRNHAAFKVASQLKDFGVPADHIEPLMLEHWPCEPMLDSAELRVTIASAYRSGNAPGTGAPEAAFDEVGVPADAKRHPFDELNERWAVVAEAPKTVVYRERVNPTTGQRSFEAFHKAAFMDQLADRRLDGKPLALAWWEWVGRRKYEGGVEFAPGMKLPSDVLNLWGGFAVKPAAGDWSLLRAHIRDVICSRDDTLDAYVMNWLARMIQRPGEAGQVALVLRGKRGAGKGTLGEPLADLFGLQHGIHLNDPQQLAGRFTGHLAGKVFVFADEAIFAGDRSSTPRLKAMITEKRLPMERKGVDIVQVRNCAHVLMASNDDWVVPAGVQERRFCVLDVSGERVGDIPYFNRIRAQLRDGGLAAMLDELLGRDIRDFNVWDYPHTAAEVDQQLATLDAADGWLHEALHRGWIAGQPWTEAGACTGKSATYDEYARVSRERKEYRPATDAAFWKRVRQILAGDAALQDRKAHSGERSVVWPSLDTAREAFASYLGRSLTWES